MTEKTINEGSLLLANLILDARGLVTRSYDWEQSLADIEKTLIEKQRRRRQDPGDPYADAYVNFVKETYGTKTLEQVCDEVCKDKAPELAEMIHWLLFNSWNNAGDWAQKLTGRKEVALPEFADWERRMEELYEKYED